MNFNPFKKILENGKKVAKVAVIGAVGLGALNSCDGNKTNDNKLNNYNDKTKNVDVKSDTQAPNSISFNEAKNDLDFEEREKAEELNILLKEYFPPGSFTFSGEDDLKDYASKMTFFAHLYRGSNFETIDPNHKFAKTFKRLTRYNLTLKDRQIMEDYYRDAVNNMTLEEFENRTPFLKIIEDTDNPLVKIEVMRKMENFRKKVADGSLGVEDYKREYRELRSFPEERKEILTSFIKLGDKLAVLSFFESELKEGMIETSAEIHEELKKSF